MKKQFFVTPLKITAATIIRNKAASDKVLWKKLNTNGLAISPRLGGKKDDHRRPDQQNYTVLLLAVLQAMGKMGATGSSHSGSGSPITGGKSKTERKERKADTRTFADHRYQVGWSESEAISSRSFIVLSLSFHHQYAIVDFRWPVEFERGIWLSGTQILQLMI